MEGKVTKAAVLAAVQEVGRQKLGYETVGEDASLQECPQRRRKGVGLAPE